MKPEEQAIDMVVKMYNTSIGMTISSAKACSLIATDLLINATDGIGGNYWERVKEQLLKIELKPNGLANI